MKWFKNMLKDRSKGQSFIELALVFMILLVLVGGVVELGNLINQYLDIIDAAREGARAANAQGFYTIYTDPVTGVKTKTPGGAAVYDYAAQVAWATLNPACHDILPVKPGAANCPASDMKIHFDPTTDDILVSVVTVSGGSIVRWPGGSVWSRFENHLTSGVSDAEILSHIDASAPTTGFIIVEIYYNYHQLLGMPFITDVIPNPIPVHAYSIMPYPDAEPTPTPP